MRNGSSGGRSLSVYYFLRIVHRNDDRENFFRDFANIICIESLFKPIRVINRTNSWVIWTRTSEDIAYFWSLPALPLKKLPHEEITGACDHIFVTRIKCECVHISDHVPVDHDSISRAAKRFSSNKSLNLCSFCMKFISPKQRQGIFGISGVSQPQILPPQQR